MLDRPRTGFVGLPGNRNNGRNRFYFRKYLDEDDFGTYFMENNIIPFDPNATVTVNFGGETNDGPDQVGWIRNEPTVTEQHITTHLAAVRRASSSTAWKKSQMASTLWQIRTPLQTMAPSVKSST